MQPQARNIPPPAYTPRAQSTAAEAIDIETASTFSAAPSYFSAAPSYSTTLGPPRTPQSTSRDPSLADFYPCGGWLRHETPSSRHYNSIASRRAEAAAARDRVDLLRAARVTRDPLLAVRMVAEEREREEFGHGEGEGGKRVRPLEDAELVGEEAAALAKAERLKREGNEILVREDKRWDWLLAQMDDWEEREKSWKRFRKEKEMTKMGKMKRRFGFLVSETKR